MHQEARKTFNSSFSEDQYRNFISNMAADFPG